MRRTPLRPSNARLRPAVALAAAALAFVSALTGVEALTVGPAGAAGAGAPGPDLRPTRAQVLEALDCTGDLTRGRAPVLLLHGTTSSAEANWSWNWDRALDARDRAHCDLQSPDSANADIQVNGEYVVRAIRLMHRRAGRDISIVGHSQGGMVGRWALKYWPDTRGMVDDYVGLSSSHHGTEVFGAVCETLGRCTPANWQQLAGSDFLTALNRGRETYDRVDYTAVSTRYDEVVVPSTSAHLAPGSNVTNVAVQDLCPTEVVDHFGMAYDNAAWLIGLDALEHRGPARLDRVPTATCGQPLMPDVDPVTFPAEVAAALAQTARSSATSPMVTAEPPLASYAR